MLLIELSQNLKNMEESCRITTILKVISELFFVRVRGSVFLTFPGEHRSIVPICSSILIFFEFLKCKRREPLGK